MRERGAAKNPTFQQRGSTYERYDHRQRRRRVLVREGCELALSRILNAHTLQMNGV